MSIKFAPLKEKFSVLLEMESSLACYEYALDQRDPSGKEPQGDLAEAQREFEVLCRDRDKRELEMTSLPSFDLLKKLFKELLETEEDIDYHDLNDSGIRPGCDCGCGGDTLDWEAATEEFGALREERAEIERKIRELIGDQAAEEEKDNV